MVGGISGSGPVYSPQGNALPDPNQLMQLEQDLLNALQGIGNEDVKLSDEIYQLKTQQPPDGEKIRALTAQQNALDNALSAIRGLMDNIRNLISDPSQQNLPNLKDLLAKLQVAYDGLTSDDQQQYGQIQTTIDTLEKFIYS